MSNSDISNSDDERDYDGNKWGCTYCSRVFKSQGEVLFHEKTWCVYEHKRSKENLEKYIEDKQQKQPKQQDLKTKITKIIKRRKDY